MNLINNELKAIASNMGLGSRIEVVAEKEAFMTLKDHKDTLLKMSVLQNTQKCVF